MGSSATEAEATALELRGREGARYRAGPFAFARSVRTGEPFPAWRLDAAGEPTDPVSLVAFAPDGPFVSTGMIGSVVPKLGGPWVPEDHADAGERGAALVFAAIPGEAEVASPSACVGVAALLAGLRALTELHDTGHLHLGLRAHTLLAIGDGSAAGGVCLPPPAFELRPESPAAPEIEAREAPGPRTDLYLLGAALTERARHAASWALRPEPVQAFWARLTAPDRADRFASAREAHGALLALLPGAPFEPLSPPRGRGWVLRPRFVGREAELRRLRDAWSLASDSAPLEGVAARGRRAGAERRTEPLESPLALVAPSGDARERRRVERRRKERRLTPRVAWPDPRDHLVRVFGPAGAGVTRLLEELASWVCAGGGEVTWIFGGEGDATPEGLLRSFGEGGSPAGTDPVESILRGVPEGGRLVVLDDADRAAPETLSFLAELLRAATATRVSARLFVALGGRAARGAEAVSLGFAHEALIRLSELPPDDVAEIVRSASGPSGFAFPGRAGATPAAALAIAALGRVRSAQFPECAPGRVGALLVGALSPGVRALAEVVMGGPIEAGRIEELTPETDVGEPRTWHLLRARQLGLVGCAHHRGRLRIASRFLADAFLAEASAARVAALHEARLRQQVAGLQSDPFVVLRLAARVGDDDRIIDIAPKAAESAFRRGQRPRALGALRLRLAALDRKLETHARGSHARRRLLAARLAAREQLASALLESTLGEARLEAAALLRELTAQHSRRRQPLDTARARARLGRAELQLGRAREAQIVLLDALGDLQALARQASPKGDANVTALLVEVESALGRAHLGLGQLAAGRRHLASALAAATKEGLFHDAIEARLALAEATEADSLGSRAEAEASARALLERALEDVGRLDPQSREERSSRARVEFA
ncbi:MAG: hypothetical protein ACYS22_18615, partial [Planctomycetota bacterium]